MSKLPRILIAECKQEVSTFNPHLSSYEDFTIREGDEILRYHRSVGNEVGGALEVFDGSGVELVPAYSACFITSGGTLEKAATMANHASTRTTQLYDRRSDDVSLDEVERILI